MRPGASKRVKRIGLVIELEDGERVMVYAEPKERAEVTIVTKYPDRVPWDHPAWRAMRDTPSRTSILIEGLDSYDLIEAKPTMADRVLDVLGYEAKPRGGPHLGAQP